MAIQNWPKTATSSDWANVDSIKWPEAMLPPDVNDSARAMGRDIAKWRDDINSTITSGGSSNAYTITSNGSYTSLANGFQLSFKANFSNTGAATLNVDSLGAKAIRKFTAAGEAALAANDIVSGGYYWVQYNTSANSSAGGWILLNASSIDGANLTADSVTYAKMQNVSATNRLLGRYTSGSGDVEEATLGTGLSFSAGALSVSGRVAQVVNTTTGALVTLSGSIPYDDTIPQNTEGTQVLSRAITPTSASSTLVISISLNCTPLAAAEMIAALFQDSTANALAAMSMYATGAGERVNIAFTHTMTAGTTSSTTFTVRCGPATSASTTGELNGSGAAARRLGGVMSSSITIMEIAP